MRKIDLIVLHCTASRPNQHISMELLDQMHRARGWKCCGYHYYITRDGQLHFGRPEEMVGAHARHYNAHSIGICYEGGLDEKGRAADTRTPAQKLTLQTLLTSLKFDYPDAEIVGHCELEGVHKACPCFDARVYRDYFKNLRP
jgi:N-acetyl-anhydromuramyl-L-alanine amidase AmpD